MGSIYAGATLTAACVGQGCELREVTKDLVDFDHYDFGWWNHNDHYQRYVPEDLPEVWARLLSLARLPYFRRLWIVQELYHSNNIYLFGGQSILACDDLEPFLLGIGEIATTFENRTGTLPPGHIALDETELARFIHFRKFRRAQTDFKTEWTDEITGHGFTGVLLSFGGGDCFDARDKIYGLLSLAQDQRWLVNFPIDYDRLLSDVLLDVVMRIGTESLTENVSRLIVTMLAWFGLDSMTAEGRTLLLRLEHSQQGPQVPWSNFTGNVVSFESVRVWKVCRASALANAREGLRIPHSKNSRMVLHSQPADGEYDITREPFEWRRLCIGRAKLVKSSSEYFWITGPETRCGDLIVEFDAMRDDDDEYSVVVVCRATSEKSQRLEIVDQASACVDLESYDAIHETNLHLDDATHNISRTELRYIGTRMLSARPAAAEITITLHLKPTDLLKVAMLRGNVLQHVRYPVTSSTSGCFTMKHEVDRVEASNRTQTFVVERAERDALTGLWDIILTSSPTTGTTRQLRFRGSNIDRAGSDYRRIAQQANPDGWSDGQLRELEGLLHRLNGLLGSDRRQSDTLAVVAPTD
ncbi:hypothetical protein LTR85_010384 [Meristemomyces frigidus]|nr:hypothetical protein LTR85_010384 [Meristemomyces frigidus]